MEWKPLRRAGFNKEPDLIKNSRGVDVCIDGGERIDHGVERGIDAHSRRRVVLQEDGRVVVDILDHHFHLDLVPLLRVEVKEKGFE